jgi:methylglyoxal synthase
MAAEVQTGMDKQEMKRLLMKSKKEPVNCAIGQGSDPSIGLLMLDRIKGPKAVEKELTKEIPDARNTRFGRAEVDVDEDPKLVKIFINKPIASMARKLVKTLKGTGFTKVQILLEDGSPVEAFEEADEQAPVETQGEARPTAPGVAPPPPPPPPPQPEAKPDPAELARLLAEQVKRMPPILAAVPAEKERLTKFATDANVQLKTNNLVYAGATIEQLRRALDAAEAQAQQAQVPPPSPPPPPQPEAKPDPAALTRLLAEQVKRIPAAIAAAPAEKDRLTKFATDANVQLKTNNLVYAGATIEQLRRALDAVMAQPQPAQPVQQAQVPPPPPPQPGTPATDGVVAYAKSRLAWLAARKKVESDLDKLRSAIVTTYANDGIAADLEKRYTEKVAPVLANLDESLADKLDEATNATDPARRAALIAEAKKIMQGYGAYLAGEKIIADLDSNPFVPIAIQQTISATLTTLEKTVR